MFKRLALAVAASASLGLLVLVLIGFAGTYAPTTGRQAAAPDGAEHEVTIVLRSAVRGCEAPQVRDGQIVITGGDDNERVIVVLPVPKDGTVAHVSCVTKPIPVIFTPTPTYRPPSASPASSVGRP